MYGQDIKRIINVIGQLNNEVAKQINLLGREADYRLAMIKHTHNVNVIQATGNPEGSPSGPHGHPGELHVHPINTFLQGAGPTRGVGHMNRVSDQLTYPEDYTNDLHETHPHILHSIVYEDEHPCPAITYIQPILMIRNRYNLDVNRMRQIENRHFEDANNWNNGYGSPWTEIYDLQSKIDQIEEYGNTYPELQWIGEKHTLLSLMQLVYTCTIDAKYAIITYQDYIQRAYDNQFNRNDPSIKWEHFEHDTTIGNLNQNISENVRIRNQNNDPPF